MQANGYLPSVNEATNHSPTRSGDGRGSGEKAKPSNRVRPNGNLVRRKPGKRIREYWDIDLPGFGLRVNPGGRQTWFVLFRQRGKLRRVSLGTSRDISPATARRLARAKLAEVALDGLPTRKPAIVMGLRLGRRRRVTRAWREGLARLMTRPKSGVPSLASQESGKSSRATPVLRP